MGDLGFGYGWFYPPTPRGGWGERRKRVTDPDVKRKRKAQKAARKTTRRNMK